MVAYSVQFTASKPTFLVFLSTSQCHKWHISMRLVTSELSLHMWAPCTTYHYLLDSCRRRVKLQSSSLYSFLHLLCYLISLTIKHCTYKIISHKCALLSHSVLVYADDMELFNKLADRNWYLFVCESHPYFAYPSVCSYRTKWLV